jgi:hypothetical protein
MNWNGYRRKRSWLNRGIIPAFAWETEENLSQKSRCLYRNSKGAPLSEALVPEPDCSVEN